MDSVFQLLSLFFMTIGRNNEAPAAYALTSTIRRLLDHLAEADLYTAKDLGSISQTLEGLSKIVHNAAREEPPAFLEALLSRRITRCRESLDGLKKSLENIAEPLIPVQEKLVSILRQLAVVNTKPKAGPRSSSSRAALALR